MRIGLLVGFVAICWALAFPVRSDAQGVEVSADEILGASGEVDVEFGSWKAVPIARLPPGRQIAAYIEFVGGDNRMAAAIVDEANLNLFRQGLQFRACVFRRS